ncbi:hypothetical protein [Actinomadura violacea]|uniref:Transcriptional regulator n=1 Tax=Actinomadura violacea TaxID=2819934 RepID=A0ABS3S7I2_9ACTN|nr:hypothetical protein [Actinomadura violacea]MBO2464954.1 hypothetical protein [Actinomadura violacea]
MPRPRTKPISNPALAAVIRRAGVTYAAFAQQVNTVAGENGYATRYNRGSVANWLTGRTPTPRVIPFVVEAAARLLGAPQLGSADLGWPDCGVAPQSPWAGDPATWLDHLGRCDMTDLDRRSVLSAGAFVLSAAAIPAAGVKGAGRTPPVRTGAADAARIKEMTETFAGLDDRFGGGHARASVAAYLTSHVVPLLRNASCSSAAVFVAAGDLAYLAGFMASDAGAAGAAQRYFIQAVRLAEHAGDDQAEAGRLRATALRAMSLQAVWLGHPAQGRDLADAAERALPAGCPLRLRAWVNSMRAEATAAAGDPYRARGLLRTAEWDLERASSDGAVWTGAYTWAALSHQTGTTLTAAGDLAAAEDHLTASLDGRPAHQRRSRTLIGSRLAHLQARRGHHDQAARTIQTIAADLPLVDSARVDHELHALRAEWRQAHGPSGGDVAEADAALADVLRRRHRSRTLL